MNNPIVSVIVPNYNHSAYLPFRIGSILQQTYTDFELILLDDCSNDNSRDVLSTYRTTPQVTHIVFNEKNSGSTFKQWEKGFLLARGKYIWIAESDDFADADFLKTTVSALEENSDSAFAFTGSQMVDAKGQSLRLDLDKFPQNVVPLTKYSSLDFLSKKMLWKNSVYNASMVLFRKAAIEHVSPEYKQFRYCGDWLFWIQLAQQGDVISINRKLNYFRQHENKVSPGAEKDGLHFIEGGRIMEYMITLLHLSAYQRLVLEGRTMKRLLKLARVNATVKLRALHAYPLLFKKGRWSILAYEFDKLFNVSRLQG